jgi:bifunctional non-homologous end joining protein LigD
LHFVVQEHQARSHHFDFRLELNGVLKSWAVPKGPSMNPHDHHLAIQTEDHPMEYQHFEGVIPEGEYGAGEVIIWDKGTYEPLHPTDKPEAELTKGLRKGHLTFIVHGKKLQGEFALIKFQTDDDKNNWLLVKKGDEEASKADITKQNQSVISGKRVTDLHAKGDEKTYPKAVAPKNVKPMLSTLVDKPFDKPGWLFEIKWDGYRAIATKKGRELQLYSRNGLDFKDKFPLVFEALGKLKDDVVLDGEIVALDEDGRPHFGWLQNWNREPQGVLRYCVFDILWHNGRDVTDMPLLQRKALLKSVLPKSIPWTFSDHVEARGESLFKQAKKNHLEGIIAKRADSPYQKDVRGQNWLKIKTGLRQETVIGGFTEPRGTRKYLGSLLLGVYKKGKLVYVGHSGGGIPTEELKRLREKLDKLERKNPAFDNPPKPSAATHWVEPKLICETSFHEWTGEGLMRQPKYEGMREDKSPETVRQELTQAVDSPKTRDARVQVAGSKVDFSHLDKIFWPEHGYTKGDLINYYQAVGKTMLPYLEDRPHSLLRQPNGYQDSGFYQKDITFKLPSWAKSKRLFSESTKEDVNFLVVNNLDSLLYMVQLGCIEINPWSSRLKDLDKPDWTILDLDPEGIGFPAVIETAQAIHAVCKEWKVPCHPKTSGKTGIHIYIPLQGRYTYEQARQFAQLIAIETHKRVPKITSLERSPDKRHRKVYIDYLQNSRGQTLAAAYSVRPTKDATVSMPLRWEEVKAGLKPTDFTIQNALTRIKRTGDLWKPVLTEKADLAKILEKLG